MVFNILKIHPSKCRLPVQHFCFKCTRLGGGSPRPLPGNSGSSPHVGRRKAWVRQTVPSAADVAPPALRVPRSGRGRAQSPLLHASCRGCGQGRPLEAPERCLRDRCSSHLSSLRGQVAELQVRNVVQHGAVRVSS